MISYKDAVKESSQGVMLSLHVIPGSAQTIFPVSYNQWRHALEIKVQAQAKDNKANIEVVETIADFFKLSRKDVVLMSGEKNREKTVRLKKISLPKVLERLKESFHE
jgi:uncharacterized protein (TIGR00251 family)